MQAMVSAAAAAPAQHSSDGALTAAPTARDASPPQVRKVPRKTRSGCQGCKRRKVKCDENKPKCSSCTRFAIDCVYPEPPTPLHGLLHASSPAATGTSASLPRRGRGRPRKDWSVPPLRTGDSNCIDSPQSAASSSTATLDHDAHIHVAEAELLHNFVLRVAGTLCSPAPDDPIHIFWQDNAPRIGFAQPFVLRLIYSFSSYHLAYTASDPAVIEGHRTVGARYLCHGLGDVNTALRAVDETTCGPLYVASMLVCYCTFAAGPSGPQDLLVIDEGDDSRRWLNLISGVRLLNQLFEPNVLYAGLLAPLGPRHRGSSPPRAREPIMYRDQTPWIDWEDALQALQARMESHRASGHHDDDDFATHRELSGLIGIFDAIYGRRERPAHMEKSNEFVLGWIYRLHSDYVATLRQRHPPALVVLAHFAVLLRSLSHLWFLAPWPAHIARTCYEMIAETDSTEGTNYEQWLEWPLTCFRIDTQMKQYTPTGPP